MAVPRVTKEELSDRLGDTPAARPTVIDVRLKYPYEHSTITLPGAVRMPPGGVDTSLLPPDRDIVVYDSDPDDLVSERVAARLIALGRRASVLRGGISEWAAAKLPTDTKPAPQLAVPMTGSSGATKA